MAITNMTMNEIKNLTIGSLNSSNGIYTIKYSIPADQVLTTLVIVTVDSISYPAS